MNRNEGHIWMEILLVLAAASIILPAGMRVLQVLLEHHLRMNRTEAETVLLIRLQGELQRSWAQRQAHPLVEEDWLILEGEREEGTLRLERLRFRVLGAGGTPLWQELSREGREWYWRQRSSDGSRLGELTFSRIGPIEMEPVRRRWPAGEVPAELSFRFPALSTRELREGFAIRAYW